MVTPVPTRLAQRISWESWLKLSALVQLKAEAIIITGWKPAAAKIMQDKPIHKKTSHLA